MFPKADWENRDPEDVPDIESPNGDGSASGAAREAVIVTKGDALRPEMVGAVNDEHGDSSETALPYISPLPQQPVITRHRARNTIDV